MTIALEIEALSVVRGQRRLFAEVSFRAPPGAFVEIRGPNGSGKTSLLRVIAGLLRPAAGAVRVAGVEEPQTALHLLGHRDGLKGSLSADAHARYWRGLFGGQGEAGDALARVGLGAIGDLPARVLSQGQARRLALTRLLIAHRPIWLLDEPAAGLDEAGRKMLAGMIEAHRAGGGIVLAALHEGLGIEGARVELGA